jgi:hypothetical protein
MPRFPSQFRLRGLFVARCGGAVGFDHEVRRPWVPARARSALGWQDVLSVAGATLDDEALQFVAEMPEVQTIQLGGAPVTDRGLECLGRLSKVKHLNLRGTRITDDGLARLANLTRVEYLNLGDTAITDIGLGHLRRFTRLARGPRTPVACTYWSTCSAGASGLHWSCSASLGRNRAPFRTSTWTVRKPPMRC